MGKDEATMEGVDPNEVERFDAMAAQWWDENGPMRPLHRMNPVRLGYIRDQFARARSCLPQTALEGLDLLDVGCGAGLLAEPLARLGANVTGIDPSEQAIEVASRHARAAGLSIAYRAASTEHLLEDGSRFDAVTALEVIEHTPDPEAFLHDLARLLKPGGLLVLSTLNRTAMSYVKAIVGAEYVLGWLPKGTHSWRRFLKPSQTAGLLRAQGFLVLDVTGIAYDAASESFRLTRARDTNYILTARRA